MMAIVVPREPTTARWSETFAHASADAVLESAQGVVIGGFDAQRQGVRGGPHAQQTISKPNRPNRVGIVDMVRPGAAGPSATASSPPRVACFRRYAEAATG